MSERPHSRKRNDSGKTGEVKRRGEGLGKGQQGNSGRGQHEADKNKRPGNSRGLFGSGSPDAFDLYDVMKILKDSQSSTRAGGNGSGFDISDLLNGLNSENTHVTNNNNIDIMDLLNMLQNQTGSSNSTITNNNNISMQDLLNALNNQNNYASGSHGSVSHQTPIQHSQPSVQHTQPSHSVPLNSGGNKKKGGSGFLFLLIFLLILFFVFGRGGCSSGGSSTINTDTNTNTNTNPGGNSANTASTWNYGTPVSHANSYVDASTASVNTEVATGSRKKYTSLLGNGNDQVTMLVYMCGTDLESSTAWQPRT